MWKNSAFVLNESSFDSYRIIAKMAHLATCPFKRFFNEPKRGSKVRVFFAFWIYIDGIKGEIYLFPFAC